MTAAHRPLANESAGLVAGPAVVAVRGPSRSGKTAMCERLTRALASEGLKVAWLKRTHHLVDLPEKSSGRIWRSGPAATVLRAGDRTLVTLAPGSGSVRDLISALPGDIDIALLETHEPEDFPTVLSSALTPSDGEHVIGGWTFLAEDTVIPGLVPSILALLPGDRVLDHAFRAALSLHGGHGCAGLVLGTRLALAGAHALGVEVPDTKKRLIVSAETDRCAVDGIQAVTGCRPGKRTLRILDYGKLAGTFYDEWNGRAVRVAARGDLRERVGAMGDDRHSVQRAAYASWPEQDLFTIADVPFALDQHDRPGPPRSRVICSGCGEEVSDGRHRETEIGPLCKPCLLAHQTSPGVLTNG